MTAISWKSAASGNWTTKGDWSGGAVPGASDAAKIGVKGTYTVSVTTAITVDSLAVTDANAVLAIGAPGKTDTVSTTFQNAGTTTLDASGAGGTTLSLGGALTNSGSLSVGNSGITAASTLNGTTLNNTGAIQVTGGTVAAAVTLSGAVTNDGSIAFAGKTTFSSSAIANEGLLDIDAGLGDNGGSSASIGALTNDGQVDIGNTGLASTVTVTAAGITDDVGGTLNLVGGTGQAILETAAAAPTTLNGAVFLTGAAKLEFGSGGIATIAANAQLSLDGTGARVVSNGAAGNSALTKLATIDGELDLDDGASISTTTALVNNNQLDVDSDYGPGGLAGGSSLTIGGVLTNNGYIGIGNDDARANTTITATSLVNNGTLDLDGEAARATLDITGAAPTTVTGYIYLYENALLEFASGGITKIGQNGELWMYGAGAHVSLSSAPEANGALSKLTSNAGTLEFSNGVAVATKANVNFTNSGDLYVDYDYSDGSDGGSSFAIGGTFTNDNFVEIGNGDIFGAATVTAADLVNSGEINITGSTNTQASLSIAAAAPTTLQGDFDLTGDALLSYGSGAITAIGAYGDLDLDGALAMVTTGTGKTSSALGTLASDAGTLALSDGATVSTTAGLAVTGSLDVDAGDSGGSSLSIAKTLTNKSFDLTIGNGYITAATTVTAGGLVNDGSIFIAGGTTAQASLEIDAAAAAKLVGNFSLSGDALLSYASGAITSIGVGGYLLLDGAKARVASGGATTTNSALTTLASVSGELELTDGTVITTTTALNDTGTVEVDTGGNGGSKFTIGETLTVGADVILHVGNVDLTAATTVAAGGLTNEGTVSLTGGTTAQASLDIGAAVPATLSGTYNLSGDALLSYQSGTISTIATGATLSLDGAKAWVSTGTSTATNSALNTLTTVDGTLELTNGAVVSTTTSLTNNGALDVDEFDDGGSMLTIGGKLTNNAPLEIGNASLASATKVSVGGLVNTADIDITGSSTVQASLAIGAAAPGTLSGIFDLSGDALLSYKSGTIATIAGTLSLDGAHSRAASGTATGKNSALTALTTVSGVLSIANDVAVSITKSLTVSGTLSVDDSDEEGGSDLSIAGTLTNKSYIEIGSVYLSAATTVSAGGLVNSGEINLGGSAGQQAALDIGAAAPSTLTGSYNLSGDALLDYTSGGITAIQGSLSLYGDSRVASGSATTTNSALTGLTTISGTLDLEGSAVVKTSGALTNSGELYIDNDAAGNSLTVAGVLTNDDYMDVGSTQQSAITTVTVGGLANASYLYLYSGKDATKLVVKGAATNSNYVDIDNANSEIDVTGGNSYTQTAGSTQVYGSLVASTIDVEGGSIDFYSNLVNGDGTGTLEIGASGTLILGGTVGTSHGVTFNSSTGELKLGTPGSFKGTISDFAGSDIIDLLGTDATAVSYAGTTASGVLTVTGASGTLAKLDFTGDYTSTTFTLQSDGSGGTEILDPPASQEIAAVSRASTAFSSTLTSLQLDDASASTSKISGFGAGDSIDLRDIAYNSHTSLGYRDTGTDQGILTVRDGKIQAAVLLLGQYAASSFALASDAHGGTLITDTVTTTPVNLAAHGIG